MPITPAFLAARAAERQHRLLIHARALAWVPLRRGASLLLLTPLVPLTHRHVVELTLARNAFLRGFSPLAGDLFAFLWRLHPLFRRPDGSFPNTSARLSFACLRSAFARYRLRRAVLRCEQEPAATTIREFLARASQDAAAPECDAVEAPAAPERCPIDNVVDYAARTYHLHPDAVLDLPIALLHQLYRDHLLSLPDGELAVFAPSDDLLSA
jgi:hypothetical protein